MRTAGNNSLREAEEEAATALVELYSSSLDADEALSCSDALASESESELDFESESESEFD